ncbi:MAG: hypothetical protein NTZ56_10735 [Acidobacteria bacterium]|nr:hypothetical protein [Acidobacteriota bacterium]
MRLTILLAAALSLTPTTFALSIDDAYRRLYNFDFTGSRELATRYSEANPQDPMGPATRGAACLFSELHRLKLLGKEFMTNDDSVKNKPRGMPKEQARQEFLHSVAEARQLAAGRSDVRSLLTMTIVTGLERDYAALVEKRFRASIELARESQGYAQRLIAADPSAKDAYFTFGFNEYLVGSVPFFLRPFVKIDQVAGNKQVGLDKLEIAARDGKYLKPFAQMMLAMFYTREKRPTDSRRHLSALAREYPENLAVKEELERLSAVGGSQ